MSDVSGEQPDAAALQGRGAGQELPRRRPLLAGRVQDGSHVRTSLVTGALPVSPDT